MEDLRSARAPVRFGPFELDRDAEELRKNGIKIRLQEQPLQILEILLQHPGKVIARELEGDVIVEGTVLRAGDRVRITAQLIDPEKETHLWAESYQRHLRDVLDLHAELAQSIARQVQVKLTPQEQAQLAQSRPVNPEAYEAYLKGRYHWNRRSREGLPKGVQYFQEAMAKDAGYAAAYAGLADCLSGLSTY